jgi:RNA polymerase sigma-70 factor (ECF subfamily)
MYGSATDSLTAAYEAHSGELQRFAAAKVRDREAAEDIVHEAYLRLAIEHRAGRFPDNPRAWLYRVTANEIVTRARRAATAARHLADQPRAGIDEESPERWYLAVERGARIGSALQHATPRAQRGLLLAAEGYSGREIAARLGGTELATRALMCRARKTVRRELAEDSTWPACA